MDLVGPIIEIVKLVGGPIVRYLKYQIKFNGYLKKFKESKEGLSNRKFEIESRLDTQLQSAAYHVAKAEVQEWLKDAEEFIRQDVENEVNSWGCLSCCCRAVILQERTQKLKEIYGRGDRYTNKCLIIEDHSKKLDYDVQNFKELKEKLQRKRGDIVSTLHSQLVYGKIEKEEVKHWREKVEEITGPIAKDIEDKVDKGGYLSHASDPTAVLLREKIQEMERICAEGSRLTGCLVIDDPSASLVELPTSELQGSGAVKAKILEWLKGKEVTKLGVWGMGGVGKTTIMKHVHNELLKENKFKKIFWVFVSQNFDICKLQKQIACSLKETLEELQNATNRAGVLSKMLEKQKPYLLILDDVWSSFRLEDVGIPEPHVADGCKLVLTTRSQEIARSMGCKRIKVETLSREEALKLFLNKVGDTVLSCHEGGIKKDLESILKKIVAECDGLPLAIVTVAGSLKEISKPWSWSLALDQLRDCKRNVAGTDADTFQILKFSYDRLNDKQIQYCFLYCALYPEDYKILKEEIVENWIDEGFVDERDSRQSTKYEGYGTLMKLVDNSLLELIEDEYERDCVRMHDLIRDMALHITRTSPRFLVEAGKSLTELPEKVKCTEDVEKISLMCNSIKEIPPSMASSTCKRLTTLLLAHNSLSTIPESVFEHMLELKILDLSFNEKLRSLPNSVSKLVKLTALLLEETSLEKVPSLSGLGSLKKLNLRGTKIKEVPEGLGMLKNLKCLFLCGSNDNILEIDEIGDGVLSNLSKLQELIVNWSRIKLKGDVVGRLMKLEVFHGWFPTMNEMRFFLKCQPNRLSSYFINVGSNLEPVKYDRLSSYIFNFRINLELVKDDSKATCDVIEELPRYEKIMVFKETSIMGENTLLPSLQVLCIFDCHAIRSLNDFSVMKDVTDLRRCLIENCDGMECVLSSWINNPVVQTLEYLRLYDLHKLDGLFEANVMVVSSPPPGTFSSLKEVRIERCEKIKKLFPSCKLMEYLRSLEEIYVKNCKGMEEIIGSDPEANIMMMSSPPAGTFSSLKEVYISECQKIKKLFPSWKLGEYLQSLEYISVIGCVEMEEIIGSDPEEEGEEGGYITKKLILPKLKMLELRILPALKSICSRRVVMACDSLKHINIWYCERLRRIPLYLPLVDNAQPSPPPSLKAILIYSYEWWESLEWDHPNAKDVLRPLLL